MRYDRTSYLDALEDMMKKIDDAFPSLKTPVEAYICGGAAIMFQVEGSRISLDVDAFFSRPFIPPKDLKSFYQDSDGYPVDLDFDYNFNKELSLLHPDFSNEATCIRSFTNLNVNILSPRDIAIMKISRFTSQDRDDIKSLISAGHMTDSSAFRKRSEEALDYYVENMTHIKYAISDVCKWIGDHNKTTHHTI